MNVCLISREYPPFFGGGIGTYTLQWSRALAAAGHSTVVVTVSDDGTMRREEADGVTIVRLPFLKGSDWSAPHPSIADPSHAAAFRQLHFVSIFGMQVERAIPDLAREFKFDVIEVPDTGAVAWFGLNNRRLGGSWSRAGMPPIVTTIHSPTAWIAEYNRQPLHERAEFELAAMERDCAHWCDAMISPSGALAEWTIRHWAIRRESVEVIPYPLGELEAVARRAHESTPATQGANGAFHLLFVGRLEPRKGVDTLLDSFSRVEAPLELALVGEDMADPARPGRFGANSLRDLVPESHRARVRVLGRRSPEELPALRDRADAIVVPSPMDNFPYVCVEAMAEGRLVIASSKGGTGEMIRDGVDGYLFEAGDAGACAKVLARAARQDPASREALRRSAAARILDYCGNQSIVERRVAHFERTTKRALPRSSLANAVRVAVVNRGQAADAAISALADAIWVSGADFAHGWPATKRGVLAFSTPSVRTLSMSPRTVGPLVVRLEAAGLPEVADLLSPDQVSRDSGQSFDSLRARNTWAVAMALCTAGCRGVCVPDVVVDVPDRELHPVDGEVVATLETIHSSRGWRVLSGIYDLLHVLRGRGLRRTYDEGRRGVGRRADRNPPA